MSVTTSPVDVVKTRIMSQKLGQPLLYNGMIDCIKKTLHSEGVSGFYKGFVPQWTRFTPFTIIQFVTWEKLRKLCGINSI